MRCPSCHNDNPPGLRMCDWCGTELPQIAPSNTTGAVPIPPAAAVSGPADKRRTRYDAATPIPPSAQPAPTSTVKPGKRVTNYEAGGQGGGPAAADDFFVNPPPSRPAPLDPDDPFAASVRSVPPSAARGATPSAAPAVAAAAPPAAAVPPPPPSKLFSQALQGSRTVAEQTATTQRRLRAALFVYRSGSVDGIIQPLYEGRNSLGRSPDRDVALDDGRVSSEHGFIYIREERHTYVDTSTNGSRVDGKVVFGEQVEVRSGSVLELGALRLVLVVVPAEALQG